MRAGERGGTAPKECWERREMGESSMWLWELMPVEVAYVLAARRGLSTSREPYPIKSYQLVKQKGCDAYRE